MAEVLGLASSIIGLASLGDEISKRLRSLSDGSNPSEDLRRLKAEVEMIVHVLHELPELLRESQSLLPSNHFESISVTLTQFADTLRSLDRITLTLQADMARPKKRFLVSFRSRDQINLMLENLENVKNTFSFFVRSVVEVLD